VLLSGRAAERLARVQHLGLDADPAGPSCLQLAAAVLQRPAAVAAMAPGSDRNSAAAVSHQHSWAAARDMDSELVASAATLYRLRLFHGSLVQVQSLSDCADLACTLAAGPASYTPLQLVQPETHLFHLV